MIHQDGYATVINHNDTYGELAAELYKNHSVIFAWTDEQATQLDILLAYKPRQYGHLQGGCKAPTDLFVAVSRFGMFGFTINGSEKHPSYIGEKLGLGGLNTTTAELAGLINGVIGELIARQRDPKLNGRGHIDIDSPQWDNLHREHINRQLEPYDD